MVFPLEWWRNQLKLDEVKERRLALEVVGKLKTVFFLHKPCQIDLITKLLICRNHVNLWEIIDDYPQSLKVTKELMDYINFIDLYGQGKIKVDTICISHERTRIQKIGENLGQAHQQKQDSLVEDKSSEGRVEETQWKMLDDMWQYESPPYLGYFSYEYLSDQNMSLSHEFVFKD